SCAGRKPVTSPAASSADEFHATRHRATRNKGPVTGRRLRHAPPRMGAPFRAMDPAVKPEPVRRPRACQDAAPGGRPARAQLLGNDPLPRNAPGLPIVPSPARLLIVKPDVPVLRYPDYCSCSAQVRSRVLT